VKKRRIRIDAKTVTAVAVAIVLLSTYWIALGLAERFYGFRQETASTYSQSETGLKVLFRYLDELGYQPRELTQFEELPESGTIVVAGESSFEKDFTAEETSRLRAWVENGGRVLLVGWQARDGIGVSVRDVAPASGAETTVSPVYPAKETVGVSRISIGAARLRVNDTGWVTVARDGGGAVLIERALGAGEVVWLADVTPLANNGIERADNALLAIALTTAGGPVYFDEYHHGFAFGGGIWQRLRAGGQAATIIGVFALFFLLLTRARRIGPPILEPETPPARTSAYIDSLAELYRKAGARPEALQVLEDGLTRALARRYGTVALGRARRADVSSALEHSATLRTRGGISESEFVSVAGQIVRLRREVEGIDG